MAYEVKAATVEWNPTAERLRELTEKMPNARTPSSATWWCKARVDSRSTRSTFIVEDSTNADQADDHPRGIRPHRRASRTPTSPASHMVVVDGYIGSDPAFRTRARLIMEAANANVAGMQKQLYYPVDDGL